MIGEPRTLKGFRDFLPESAKKRQFVLDTLRKVFSLYGFEPLETPALEYEEILIGKYGAEGDKLMYRFEDNGQRKVALRYDQTVPLARIAAQYQNELPVLFKRYQMQNVWRAENTQKGRYREFLQVDADIVGTYSPLADAEIIALSINCLKALNFKNFKIIINDRSIFANLNDTQSVSEKELPFVIRAIDKLKKIGEENVLKELVNKGFSTDRANLILQEIKNQKETTKIKDIFLSLIDLGIEQNYVEFLPTLARGLDYYTGLIFEIEVEGYNVGSVAGGGRYDNLIGMFAGKEIPAVGFAFGFDRLIEAMESLNLFPVNLNSKNVLVAFAKEEMQKKAIEIASVLRIKNINAEVYFEKVNLEKQLKYANKKLIPNVLIVNENNLLLKSMSSGEQKEVNIENLINELL